VIVVHHAGKADSAKQYRGSSDIKASVDCAYHLASKEAGRLRSLILTPFKQREGNAGPIGIEYRDGAFAECGKTNRDIIEGLIRQKPGSKAAT